APVLTGEILLGAERERLALDGGDALVALLALAGVDGHDEDALAEQALRARAGEAVADPFHPLRIEAAVAPEAARGVVVGHHIAYRPVALGLDDQPAVELQRGAHDRGEGAGLAQEVRHRLRIVVARQYVVDHLAQPDDPPADGPAFDLEGGDEV